MFLHLRQRNIPVLHQRKNAVSRMYLESCEALIDNHQHDKIVVLNDVQ